MKILLKTLITLTTVITTNVVAEVSGPYAVFNPLAMFENSAHLKAHQANSAFNNYGNKSYEFVVDSTPLLALPTQAASLYVKR